MQRANVCVSRIARAWLAPPIAKSRAYSEPFREVIRETDKQDIIPATREEAYALSEAIAKKGHPHLAVVPLICFEWFQRPENVLDGYLTWADWRSSSQPRHLHVIHHKTGARVGNRLKTIRVLCFQNSKRGSLGFHAVACPSFSPQDT